MTSALFSRRSFLASACIAALAGPAQAELPLDPWAPRKLTGDERARLMAFRERLGMAMRGAPADIRFVSDHVRLRFRLADLFANDRGKLTDRGLGTLTVLAEELHRERAVRAEITGHLHSGKSSYESYIASRRNAVAVEAALLSRGIPQPRLLATGLGEMFPIAGSPDLNHRVEILIRPL